jgi:hypothetical protein
MPANAIAPRWLEQEARALLTRLARIRPFALQETMLPAAALSPAALVAIERLLVGGRYELREQVREYLRWLAGAGAHAGAAEQQRRFTLVRLRFNDVLSQFDLFSEVVTQRSEAETGVWLAGLDVLAADALTLDPPRFAAPQMLCYLARGPGAAVRRARTRLPGGEDNPVAIIRVPRERMVGHGIASSLVHEVGHQAAALLDLVPALRARVRDHAGDVWARTISEIVADLWSVAKLGIGSTIGLMGVVSLPAWFMFRIAADDPHPAPWIRVRVSCALGDALYPDPQWRQLAGLWAALYPLDALPRDRRRQIEALDAGIPALVEVLLSHRPEALRGATLGAALPLADRRPADLAAHFDAWRAGRVRLRDASPVLAFAVLGQGRALGRLAPEEESRTVGNLLTYWALRSTLDLAEVCSTAAPVRHELQPA